MLNSKSNNNEHIQIINELSLEDIDFEEPITSKKNNTIETLCSKNNIEEKTNDISEYRKKLMNIGKPDSLQIIQCDNTNVINFNAENISNSQWSKGDVVLNGKPLEVCLILKNI